MNGVWALARKLRRVGVAFRAAVLLAAGCTGAAAEGHAQAVVLVAEDGGFEPGAAHAIRALTAAALSERGLVVLHDRRLDEIGAPDRETTRVLSEIGARRLFVVRIGGRLGAKVPLSLEEVRLDNLEPVWAASLIAIEIEEADRIVPRLVAAVLDRQSVQDAARVATVTVNEGEPVNKRSGEHLWAFGVLVGSVGLSASWMHEAERWRVGVCLEGPVGAALTSDRGRTFLGVDGAWVPKDGDISPYVGGGVGVVAVDGKTNSGARLEAGLEIFRLHRVRLMVGGSLLVPFFHAPHGAYPNLIARLAF